MSSKAVFSIALATLASFPAAAQRSIEEEILNETVQDCVVLRRIDDTVVIDDLTILFYMRGDAIYKNQLDRTCINLGRSKRFSYRAVGGQLCDSDTITVYDPFDRFPGVACRLGDFQPITEEEAERLKTGEVAEDDGIEVETIDLPVEDEAGSGETGDEPAAIPDGE